VRPYMDFIERWFGISPDGGNGTTELVCIAFILAAGAVFAFRGQILDFARRRFNIPYVSSRNSDPLNSRNSEPSGKSHKG